MLYNYVTTTNDTSILTRALPLAEVPYLLPNSSTVDLRVSRRLERAFLVAQQPYHRGDQFLHEQDIRYGSVCRDEHST